MSSNNVPSKVEVMGWNPQSLADYMRTLKLSGCDKVVIKGSITGAQFMQMTASDLQLFPVLYIPIITKIQSEINKEGQKRKFGREHLSSGLMHFPPVSVVQEEEVWNSDEFDYESDHDSDDYEGPHLEEGEDNGNICALKQPQTAAQRYSNETYEVKHNIPSSANTMRPKLDRASKPRPHIDRSRKPGLPGQPQKDLTKINGSTVKVSSSSTSKIPEPGGPRATEVSSRGGKLLPAPPEPTQPANNSIPVPSTAWDPSWYGGKMTRHEAELALRGVNKDGAFVVRDSSKGAAEHPYTLMLLKQGKVYNIMIRNQGNSYSLGSGLKYIKCFPGLKEMITHHTHTPLMLIDATDQSSEAHCQCCLLHPAGL